MKKWLWIWIVATLVILLPASTVLAKSAAIPFTNGAVPGAWSKYSGNPVLNPGASSTWDDTEVFDPSVLLDGTTYRMWFTGGNASFALQLGYASSTDGIHWTPNATPVLTTGSGWDASSVRFATVIKDGSTYKMWYTGSDNATKQIGYATSTDGVVWNRYSSNPVVPHGGTNDFDSVYAGEPTVIKTGAGYMMWYAGRSGSSGAFGLATSSDGTTWTKYAGNPVFNQTSNAWDTLIYAPQVVFDGARYHMWYSGCDGTNTICQVGYAVSGDGIHWGKHGVVMPMGTGVDFDSASADYPAVILDGDQFKMWYSGIDSSASPKYHIGYATAPALSTFLFLPQMHRGGAPVPPGQPAG